MSTKRIAEEFKIETAGQMSHMGNSAAEVAAGLGARQRSMSEWIQLHSMTAAER